MDYWRQEGIVTPGELPGVTLIGAGGIGSFTALALAKMGVERLSVWDPDRVEDHNVPNQLYTIGQAEDHWLKVEALYALIWEYTNIEIAMNPVKYSGAFPHDVTISAVDSMEARKEIWDAVKMKIAVPLYIEARMGAEVSRIYSINPCDPDQCKFYEETLYTDGEALPEPCTARAIIYNGFAIAALIANQVKKWAKHESLFKEIILDLKTLTLLTQ